MARSPLPKWLPESTTATYRYIGGVPAADIWVTARRTQSEWDAYFYFFTHDQPREIYGLDLFVGQKSPLRATQREAFNNVRHSLERYHIQGDPSPEEQWTSAMLLLRCFTPHLFRGKLWPEAAAIKVLT